MPWLRSASKVIIAVIIDILLIVLFVIFKGSFLSQYFFTLPFLFIWILVSYISGRYSEEDYFYSVSFFLELIKLISTIFISTLIISNLKFNLSEILDGFQLAFIFFLLSFLFQYLYKLNYKFKNFKYSKWLVFADKKEIRQLQKYLKETKKSIKLKNLELEKYNIEKIKNNFKGILVSNDNEFTEEQNLRLKFFENNGVNIISKLTWCEYVLQRIPSELITRGEKINKDFLKKSHNFDFILKRIGDISLSIFLILITSPILLISSFLIWYEDKGPVLYSQVRSGYRGKQFRVWKLRTMKVNAEKDLNPVWATKNDPRITKVGIFLRKCRLDELPQLINVISGSMSLIGPRPERPYIEETLNKKIKNYDLRGLVKPGLSGWAQVNYPYGASILDSKIKCSYDVFYIRNQSTLLDILILMKTIRLVFNFKGSEPIQKT